MFILYKDLQLTISEISKSQSEIQCLVTYNVKALDYMSAYTSL